MLTLNEVDSWRAEMLASNGGYSLRYIASYIFNRTIDAYDGYKHFDEIAAVRAALRRKKIRVTDWRNGRTAHARTYAKSAANLARRKKAAG